MAGSFNQILIIDLNSRSTKIVTDARQVLDIYLKAY
jgi:hypothetical protein